MTLSLSKRAAVFLFAVSSWIGVPSSASAEPTTNEPSFASPSESKRVDGIDDGAQVRVSTNERAVSTGAYLPLTMSPALASPGGFAAGFGGYDSGRSSAVMSSVAEVRLFGPLALRGGVEYSDGTQRIRPSVGARIQLLFQEKQGIDGSVAVGYRPEGFTEPEGEIETVVAFGKRFARGGVFGNVAYGQDPEGRERDGEVRGAGLFRLNRILHVGIDARWRFNLGSDPMILRTHHEATYDADVGPVAALVLGSVSLTAHSGVSVVHRIDESARVGAVATAGIATAF